MKPTEIGSCMVYPFEPPKGMVWSGVNLNEDRPWGQQSGAVPHRFTADCGEAVSPTVSQLSAVFERAAELRNNLHRLSSTPPLPSTIAASL